MDPDGIVSTTAALSVSVNIPAYVLGSDEAEIARLQTQANLLAEPTDALLRRAGLQEGMRVLDLGSGPGDVAFLVARIVGPEGSVVGVERDPVQIGASESRLAESGADNIVFRQGDARTFTDGQPFDAVVCRLLLMHLPDAVEVLAHHMANLRPGGLFVAVDYDQGGSRALPEVALYTRLHEWLRAGFQFAHADTFVGARFPVMFAQAGYTEVGTLGLQMYWSPDNSHAAAAYFVGLVRAMKTVIVESGAATESEIGLDTLEQRLADELQLANAVSTMPTVVGGWGRRPG
jgi:ubiquinone/menaquinone biosynthesis C-methylase UbiE